MRLMPALTTLGAALVLAGCASQPVIHSDYDKAANSTQYRTYAFAEKSSQSYLTLTEQTLRNDISQQLNNRGYRQQKPADLLVYVSTQKVEQTHVEGGPAMIGWGGYVDLTLYIQTLFLSYGCDNFLRIYSRGERYPSALCG
ncbi:DUF4136 domain-containing protein [Pluralibacter sp.]|uniref:DUF4136 domain-containing protein n=1 Tax=Pluralibacter sp. TaxID=1920032 RepID=UPI0025D94A64|nr:DUF4136 domain-containing protein [Pluralibacter sp.]MBV8044521.1 DUF4136 domain-containing protein [Pluralibacter sp.]